MLCLHSTILSSSSVTYHLVIITIQVIPKSIYAALAFPIIIATEFNGRERQGLVLDYFPVEKLQTNKQSHCTSPPQKFLASDFKGFLNLTDLWKETDSLNPCPRTLLCGFQGWCRDWYMIGPFAVEVDEEYMDPPILLNTIILISFWNVPHSLQVFGTWCQRPVPKGHSCSSSTRVVGLCVTFCFVFGLPFNIFLSIKFSHSLKKIKRINCIFFFFLRIRINHMVHCTHMIFFSKVY